MNLLQMSFYGTVMIIAIAFIRIFTINKLSKKIFLVLWGIVLVRLILPFTFPSYFSIYSFVNLPNLQRNISNATVLPSLQSAEISSVKNTIEHFATNPVSDSNTQFTENTTEQFVANPMSHTGEHFIANLENIIPTILAIIWMV